MKSFHVVWLNMDRKKTDGQVLVWRFFMVCQALCGGGRKKPIYIIYKEKEKSRVLMQMLTGLFTLCESPEILQGKIGLQFLILGTDNVVEHYEIRIKIRHGCLFEGWPNRARPSHPFLAEWLECLCPVRSAFKRTPVHGFDSFFIILEPHSKKLETCFALFIILDFLAVCIVKLMVRFIFWPDAFIFWRSYFNSLCPRIMLMHRTNLSRPKLIVVLRLWSTNMRSQCISIKKSS